MRDAETVTHTHTPHTARHSPHGSVLLVTSPVHARAKHHHARLSRHGHMGGPCSLVGSPCSGCVWGGPPVGGGRSAGENTARVASPAPLVGLRILCHDAVHAPRPVRRLLACASNELPQCSDFDQRALQRLSSQRHACLRPVRGSGQPRPISRLAGRTGHTGLAFDMFAGLHVVSLSSQAARRLRSPRPAPAG